MAKAQKSLTIGDFFKRFPTDDACVAHLFELRYGADFPCPKCGVIGTFRKLAKHPAYTCNCGHHVHPMQGTIFQDTHTPLAKWFYAIYLFTTTRHGVPAKELQRQLGVSYPTAFRMAHLIREHMGLVDGNPRLGGHTEADETFVGGRKRGVGRGNKDDKTVVFGMLERGGDVMTKVVPDTRGETLGAHIVRNVEKGTIISTDEHLGYSRLRSLGYRRGSVNHRQDEWVNGPHDTNSLEAFWSMLKRSIRGTHVHVSAKHLAKYLGEFEFLYNIRHCPQMMFSRLVESS
ncbi:MAG TPA: IS1595 family transposase [Rhizomicrobium sp.]|nr:IS1595 family transposase [Rhizomicrobium sp.]